MSHSTRSVPHHIQDLYPVEPFIEAFTQDVSPQQDTQRHFALRGASDALTPCLIADMAHRLDRFVVLITDSQDAAQKLARNLRLFVQSDADGPNGVEPEHEVLLFPEYDVGPFHHSSPDRKSTMGRLSTLHRLTQGPPPRILVTSIRAAIRKTIPKDTLLQYTRTLEFGDEVPNHDLRALFTHCGYTEVPVVEDPGTFSIRGDIVDFYTPGHTFAVRMERWGDEISELRAFHPQTQRTIRDIEHASIFPVRQEILDSNSINLAHTHLHALGQSMATPTSLINSLMADLHAGIHFIGIDALLPALHTHLESLTDYLPKDALITLIRPQAVFSSMRTLWTQRHDEYTQIQRDGELFFPPDHYYTKPADLISWLKKRAELIEMHSILIEDADEVLSLEPPKPEHTFTFKARENNDVIALRKSSHSVEQTVRALAEHLDTWSDHYGRICFACRNPTQVDRLVSLLQTFKLDAMAMPTPIDVSTPIPPPAQIIEVYHAPMTQGFRSEVLGLCLIAGSEVFGSRVSTTQTDAKSFSEHVAISHFRDLCPGDLVVHVDFGIGRYQGLVHFEVEGIGNDFLQLEYAGKDKLYLPIYRLGRVQKYIGADSIRLDKLGGNGWERTKEKVKTNIRAIAGELLKLYAKREMAKGFAFSAPDEMYHEFQDRFPFEETPDQARAILDTISDMTKARPMDRLICGDVGFGKTEVAIRAAMKAVVDSKQVAVLVPTTILAEQHQISFKKRMEEFGVVVACLSRFRSAKESRAIIERANQGKVDVLIGTHRLLNKEIKMPHIGLLIVDEEQRFGVTHKERIKTMRHTIDILTLSATPIPRTLQMSLLGIRDLSIIASPPHNRLAVRTHVAKFSDRIIREAVMRELSRGGQVFFVHNRVATIEQMAEHISELIPEARIGIGHGQMPEHKLEEVMLAYVRGDINILLCSSIVESGLDIPNANTIIINRADLFGLSQLYQLRGRVGRGNERAYAYLLIPNREKLPKDSEKRLDIIQTHTELGSGFHVASYDLEIRGSGSLLGEDQTGHVTSVGLDLYNELLEDAVHDIRGEDQEDDFEPEVNIAIATYIDEDYIESTSLRLMFYKRFSLARTLEELGHIHQEMIDRFGNPPEAVLNLRGIVAIKIGLRQLRARKLDAGPSAISIEIDASTQLKPQHIIQLVQKSRGKMRLTEDMKLIYKLKPDESLKPLQTSRMLIDTLLATI